MRVVVDQINLLAFLSLLVPINGFQVPFLWPKQRPSPTQQPLNFKLQHAVHIGTHRYPGMRLRRTFTDQDRREIDARSISLSTGTSDDSAFYPSNHQLATKKGFIWTHNATWEQWNLARRKNVLLSQAARGSKNSTEILAILERDGPVDLGWQDSEIEMPDVTHLKTLSSLAKMTNDAYTIPDDDRWVDPGKKWNISNSFGWEQDGLRGHVFATADNKSVVIAIKGTSAGLLGNGGSTGANDKLNDNLLFSCCCARVSWSWSTVCDCYQGPYQCRQSCVEQALIDKSVYFPAAVEIYNDIVTMYPHARIWLAGHSLGAALASLLGLTFGVPVVGFESPGDLLPARRLHLPLPPTATWGEGREMSGVTHVFHTADPIAMGTCNGVLSTCSVAGYAMESRCHVGRSIIYDTVGKLNWAVDIRTHAIKTVIESVLIPDWDPTAPACQNKSLFTARWPWSGKRGNASDPCDGDEKAPKSSVPEAAVQSCEEGDCFKWEFKDNWDDQSSLDC
ncbi:hypothetical protein CROQUDRAFT_667247 [Cronartium quercuum f. sp. fusiforme G11]|uniref:triacylglycerol lipase n=1 Tax=Cronartium quercuum f. sp. fusiforme G11 TaxID=708437 RepID=A0A9P6TH17_9BASI|nr:hypothetical protein CROQUDRAFT_667247 [Cronartium quercuum f. sp. fusiforme G11]